MGGRGGGRRWGPGHVGIQFSSRSFSSLEQVSTFRTTVETEFGSIVSEHGFGAGARFGRAVATELSGAELEIPGASGCENELDSEKLEPSRSDVDSRFHPRIAGAETDFDGLESENFVGVELEPPGVAGAVSAIAPNGALLDRVDVGLRCRSPVVRGWTAWKTPC